MNTSMPQNTFTASSVVLQQSKLRRLDNIAMWITYCLQHNGLIRCWVMNTEHSSLCSLMDQHWATNAQHSTICSTMDQHRATKVEHSSACSTIITPGTGPASGQCVGVGVVLHKLPQRPGQMLMSGLHHCLHLCQCPCLNDCLACLPCAQLRLRSS